ncbi:transmembrane protein 183 isoform X2 [Contarinia nasturtii]|uniref:transmembrane protein 183 isoform X2 n=1 Tax=Contarinia nasturtii TaxID=265458 RepID=UPI0012D49809|nr:transmembrane protein 183 isoform X2 [Contarinia nasturtii]
MPRNRSYYNYSDISIKEYADANNKSGRIRKGVSNTMKSDATNSEYEALDIDADMVTKKMSKSKIANVISVEDDQNYNYFPNDIWQTYTITTTLKFWKCLYRRYYKANVELPMRLTMDCMTRPRGIRACTIRSLFFTYPSFVNRVRQQSQQDFHMLVKHRVVQFWFQQIDAMKFLYFYKIKRKLQPGSRTYESEQLQRKDNRTIKALRDVYFNTEEGCSLLMIESTKFHPLPRLDMIESNVFIASIVNHLSRSCNHYRLEIQFNNISCAKVGSVVYEPASSIRVYDWWVPTYSKYVKQGLQPSLEYVKDEKDSDDNNQNITDDDSWDYVINNF